MVDFANRDSGCDLGYFEIIDQIDADLIFPTHEGLGLLASPWPRRRFWIRHDVDDRIDMAWEMATAEAERGIRAAYFFLHTAPYFRWAAFLDMARDFVQLGHTIGLHNNAIAAAMRNGGPELAEPMLKRDLAYLRKAGEVFITSSHGDLWNRLNKTTNYEMFAECRHNGFFIERRPLADYGLRYEAYHTPHNVYLSEAGRKWNTSPIDTIERFNATESAIMQVLVHPQWWEKHTKEA